MTENHLNTTIKLLRYFPFYRDNHSKNIRSNIPYFTLCILVVFLAWNKQGEKPQNPML